MVESRLFDRARYWSVVRFFAGAFASFIFWDLLLRHLPLLGGLAQASAETRWRGTARRFRALAIRLGGVLIKLGQFLSIRVDILPPSITSELSGLQDEVPAESLADVEAVIAAEFGRPAAEIFAWFAPEPEAAASLAQVHRARLFSGQEVVVKVRRRHIEKMMETDLAAIGVAVRWLKWYRPIARRVDLDRLFTEFATTTRRELDFIAEGRQAERFAANFAADPYIYVARVYWEYTTAGVLTLENVAHIKITDLAAIEAAGICRTEVARRLYEAYLEQIFVHNFVHADPHPGNLFVRPLPPTADDPHPFQLIFVDFGMVAVIPERLRASLREYVIAIGTRDSHRLVQAYLDAGVLLPGADRQRLEEVHDLLFQRLDGIKIGQLRDVALQQADFLWREYRDLLFELPFQFPADMIFAMRAVAILAGIATTLDPNFDPWASTIPFAERLAADQFTVHWRSSLQEVGDLLRLAIRLPGRLDRIIARLERGDIVTQTALAPDTTRALRGVERALDRLAWTVVAASLLVAGILLRTAEGSDGLSAAFMTAAGVTFLWGLARR